ncbi:MAG: PA4642 family protein [Spongiibacteraceae bacterium]|jgi:ankyrin repeat protein|nr:PA4642 family protein [Spongiibacteraceae bacterium]
MAKKDKEKVIDEVWTEARVREFLDVLPAENVDPDFHRLLKAYQAMRAEDFAAFVAMFVESGGNINARDRNGRTVLSYVIEHRNSGEYAEALRQHGAI